MSLSIDNSTVSMNISPTNVNGSFNKSSASTISASTNNATGYTLSISAPAGSGTNYDKLINSSDSTAKLSSISEATAEAQFKDFGSNGNYWSSTACSVGNSHQARMLYFETNVIGSASFYDRKVGFSVRCILAD